MKTISFLSDSTIWPDLVKDDNTFIPLVVSSTANVALAILLGFTLTGTLNMHPGAIVFMGIAEVTTLFASKVFLNAAVEKIKIKQDIEKFTEHFLWPYITNQIDPHSPEEINRISMIETLFDHLKKQFPSVDDIKDIEEIALNSYILTATRGFFQNKHTKEKINDFPLYLSGHQTGAKEDEEYQKLSQWYLDWNKIGKPELPTKHFLILLQALVPALTKDFPNLSLTSQELIKKVTNALSYLLEKQNIYAPGEYEKIMNQRHQNINPEDRKILNNYLKDYMSEMEYKHYVNKLY